MNSKNLDRREFLKLSGILTGAVVLNACTPLSKKVMSEPKEPVKVDYETTSNGYFDILNKDERETGVFAEEGLYKKLSEGKKEGELVEIPNYKGLYVKAGQGRGRALWNNLKNGGGYMQAYSKGNPVDEVYISEKTVRDACYLNTGEQIYDGRFVKIPGTNLEARCVVFDCVQPLESGGGDGGSGGGDSGGGGQGGSGASGGGGQGGGGGSSGGGR